MLTSYNSTDMNNNVLKQMSSISHSQKGYVKYAPTKPYAKFQLTPLMAYVNQHYTSLGSSKYFIKCSGSKKRQCFN